MTERAGVVPIRVWPFDQAPKEWQALSTHGGDEDWLMHVPASYVVAWPEVADDEDGWWYGQPEFKPWKLENLTVSLGVCRVSYHRLDDGACVAIGAHA